VILIQEEGSVATETRKDDAIYYILAVFASVWAIVCIAGLLSITPNSSQSTEPRDAQETTQPDTVRPPVVEKQQPTQASPFSVTEGDRIYSGARSGDVGVAILKVTSSPYLGSFKAAGTFITVTVAIFNGQNSAITVDTGLFAILDSTGNEYSPSVHSADVGANDLFLAQLNPGITKVGEIVFDAPASLDVDTLQLRFRGGMTGDAAVIPLKANFTAKPPAGPIARPNENSNPDAAGASGTAP
jgi:hypothetical protein